MGRLAEESFSVLRNKCRQRGDKQCGADHLVRGYLSQLQPYLLYAFEPKITSQFKVIMVQVGVLKFKIFSAEDAPGREISCRALFTSRVGSKF